MGTIPARFYSHEKKRYDHAKDAVTIWATEAGLVPSTCERAGSVLHLERIATIKNGS